MLTMAEQTDLRKYLDTKFDEITRRFDKNDEEHKQINDHFKELNGQVAKNTAFRNKYRDNIEKLMGDRERKISIFFDFLWKTVLVGTLILLGLQNYTNLI